MSVTSIRLKEGVEKSLAVLAQKTNRSKNWLINQAIKEYLDNQAIAEERWLETLPALESVRTGKSVPAEAVEDWLISWGKDNEGQAPEA